MRRNLFICLLLAGVTLAVYWPARHFDLVYFDDPLFVTENGDINSGVNLASLKWAMTSIVAANWHPVTNFSFLLTHQFFGQNSGAEHLVNVIFHVTNALLLFLLLQRMTGATWRSAIMAALFAWHPLRVESVAWIAERKDVLSGFFLLLTLWTYVRYAEEKQRQTPKTKWFYVGSVGLLALGLMSKAMLVTTPFLLLLLDYWPLKRIPEFKSENLKPLLLEKIPFFLLVAIFSALTFVVQQSHAAMSSTDRVGLDLRVMNIIVSYLRYLGKAFWPVDLAILYPFPVSGRSYLALWPDWQIAAALMVLALISWLCLRLLQTKPYLAIGWFWYLGTMIPVIGLVQVGGQGMADRYTYLPLIGLVISVVWWLAELWKRNRFQKIFLATITAFALLASVITTRKQLQFWRDTENLFSHTVAVTGDNYLAQLAWGNGLEHAGRASEAMVQYRVAIQIYPTDVQGYRALGQLLVKQQYWPEAAETLAKGLEISPDDAASHASLADALQHLGRKTEAVQHLEAALRADSNSPEILNNLAWLLASSPEADLRDGPRAVQLAGHACELSRWQKTLFIGTLAAAYAEAGRFDEAITTAQRAIANAEKLGETALAEKNRELLALYQTHQVYHEPREKLVPAAP